MLAVARAAGETAPLLFTALFSDYWISDSTPEFLPKSLGDLMKPTASLAVLIYNFSARRSTTRSSWPGRRRWCSSPSSSCVNLCGAGARATCRGDTLKRREGHVDPQRKTLSDSGNKCGQREPATARTPTRSSTARSTSSTTASSRPCATSTSRSRRARITAFIGPSGCGKSTALRCLNRMNDLVRGFRFKGHVHFRGQDIYHPRGRSGRRAPSHRHGVPAAQPVRDEHLSQRRLRPAAEPLPGQRRREGRAGAARARRCGTRSRTSCTAAACRCPAASSSACASRAPSPPSRRSC